ncbi:hypothetical protein RKD29_004013 [Streptomyces tendae]
MSHVRPSGRRFAVAVTVVLAVSAGLTGVPGPAGAAIPAPSAATALQAASGSVPPFPVDQELTGVTASGYVVRDQAMRTRSWVRASDGAVTELGEDPVRATGRGDLLAVWNDDKADVRDLASGRTVLSVPIDSVSGREERHVGFLTSPAGTRRPGRAQSASSLRGSVSRVMSTGAGRCTGAPKGSFSSCW